MNPISLVLPVSVPSLINYRSLFGSLLLFVLVIACNSVSAQNLARPVARLIASSTEVTGLPSSRRVNFVDVAAAGAAHPIPVISPSIDEANATERRAFEITNELRVKNSLVPLVWDSRLCLMARSHSRNMATVGFFAHESPEGLRLRDRARAVGISRFRVLAENIAYNQGDDPGAFAVERWMLSSGHRENILSTEFQASAIGSFVAADGRVYLTQGFITR